MKVGIYRKPVPGVMAHAYEGLEVLGWDAQWRNPNVFTPDQVEAVWDFVIVLGYRMVSRAVIEAYNRIGVPGLIVDLGYLRRPVSGSPEGYYQIGLNGLNWIPQERCPPDRWKALGLERTKRMPPKDGYVLVCGQVPEDAQHGMDEPSLIDYSVQLADLLRKFTARELRWRPHPYRPTHNVKGYDSYSNSKERTLQEDLDGAWAMVTYNSTAAFQAIFYNVPVFSANTAIYAPAVNTDIKRIENPKPYTTQALATYFSRLAYAQWDLWEIANGLPFRYMASHMERWRTEQR